MSRDGFELVIFDCDGVLVDSELIAHEVLREKLAAIGIEMSLDETMRLFMGNVAADSIAIIERRLGGPLPEGFFDAFRGELYEAFRRRPVRAVAGVERVLDALDAGAVRTCVVSNGPFEKMRTTLGVTGLLPRFEDALFSPDLGLRGKPHPDLFLAAAERFGADPGRTAVVEDSSGGITGARGAGMHAFGYAAAPHTDAAALEAAGAVVFERMAELVGLLAASARTATS